MFFGIEGNRDRNLKLERLYMEYRNAMFYVANNILHDEFLAEDAVHQSFLRIYNCLDKIDENNCRKTRNFLVIICKHISIDVYNRRKKNAEDELDSDITSVGDSIPDIVISNANIERLHELIGKLKPIYQEAIFYRFFYEFSVEEIAALKSINVKNAQKRIERSKKQLLKLLSEEGELNE